MTTLFLKSHYVNNVIPQMVKSRAYKNKHQAPAIEKMVINTGISATLDKGGLEETIKDITRISGQKPIVTKARTSISNFKVREGMPLGVKVTLRGNKMYDFLHKFISIVLPGIRDFRGIQPKLDGNGNYTLGIKDHTIFPEINMDSNKRIIGMDVTIVTSAATDDLGLELLTLLGMPFRKK